MINEADVRHHSLYSCLDGLRVIAALFIVLRHTKQLLNEEVFQQSYLAVDFFFLLSGFVIANAYEQQLRKKMTAGIFICLRIIRLYPLYAAGIVLATISSITDGANIISLTWHGLLSLLFLPNPNRELILAFPINVPAWSLFFELIINIFYAYTLFILTRSKIIITLLASFAVLVGYTCYGEQHNLDIGWSVRTLPGGFARVIFSFYVGVIIYRYRVGVTRWQAPPLYQNVASWFLVFILGAILVGDPAPAHVPAYDLAAVAIAFPSIVCLGIKISPSGLSASVFKFGGATSYAVYILHEPLGKIFGKSYIWITGYPIEAVVPVIGFIFILFLFASSWLLDKFYDGPIRTIARRFLESHTRAR